MFLVQDYINVVLFIGAHEEVEILQTVGFMHFIGWDGAKAKLPEAQAVINPWMWHRGMVVEAKV